MKRSSLACVCSVLLATAVFSPSGAAASAGGFAPWGVDLGLELGQFEYEEPGVMTEKGLQYGLYASYTHHFFENARVQLYASVVGGDLDYDGGLSGEDPDTGKRYTLPATGESPNAIFNGRLTGGYRFPVGPVRLTPFAGYGYRFLRNDLNQPLEVEGYGTFDDPRSGYWRDQTYHYLPLGLLVGAALPGGWEIEGTLEYDVFLGGSNHSYNDYGIDQTFTQSGGSGYRFAVKFLSPAFFERVRVSVEPFYEHWAVDDSDIVEGFLEPNNSNSTFGLRVGASL